MFTGIIQTVGTISEMVSEAGNKIITVGSNISNTLRVDQSVAHQGVCLTVIAVDGDTHRVVAVEETIKRSTLNDWQMGDLVNIERCLSPQSLLDGHIVQGHVDEVAICTRIAEAHGSWLMIFSIPEGSAHLLVEKGSVTVNGVSLTCFDVTRNGFSIAIIPYTYDHTQFCRLTEGQRVNIEYDIIGKYVQRYMEQRFSQNA